MEHVYEWVEYEAKSTKKDLFSYIPGDKWYQKDLLKTVVCFPFNKGNSVAFAFFLNYLVNIVKLLFASEFVLLHYIFVI